MPEPQTQDSQGSLGIAAPEFFAAVDLSTRATDKGQLAQARVVIVDEGGEPVSGIAVYGTFTKGIHIAVQAHTNSMGVAYFESLIPGGAQAGFEVELVSYEIAGELAYVRPQSIEQGATSSSSRTAGDSFTTPEDDGMGTSTGVTSADGPAANGMGTSTGADPEDDGMGTSTGIASEDGPADDGMGTSTGADPEDNGMGTSTGADPEDNGMGTSTGADPEANGMGTSTGADPEANGMGTSTGEQAPN